MRIGWLAFATYLSVVLCGCRAESPPIISKVGESSSAPRRSRLQVARDTSRGDDLSEQAPIKFPFFSDVHEEVGIVFIHQNGADGRALMVQSTSGGCGWLDFDNDSKWDLVCAQGGDPAPPPGREKERPPNRLFRNRGDGSFEDVTDLAGVGDRAFGHGIAVGDYDDDGFDDVMVSNVGRNSLYRNLGDGTFDEVAVAAGIGKRAVWSASAAWGDLNQDGFLDLYVGNYVKYDPYRPVPCTKDDGSPGVCHPKEVQGETNSLYFNNGDGTFRFADPEATGTVDTEGKSLGVAIADFNNDGRPDVYVANDITSNCLFLNQGDGTFIESALELGCAVSSEGYAQASMGIAVCDYDRNGWLDLYVCHFTSDSNTLYANLGEAGFQDVTRMTSVHRHVMDILSFGVVIADFNQDGCDDVFLANGHIDDWRHMGENYAMFPLLFTFDGRRWRLGSDQGGEIFKHMFLGRAVAGCDYDDDGDLDLAVIHQNAPMALLRNDSERGHWLKLRFIGRNSNRRAIGTRVELVQGEKKLMQELAGGTSFCATHQPVIIFGLGDADQPCSLRVRWPQGTVQDIHDVDVDQAIVLEEPL